MMTVAHPHQCANPGCTNVVPPATPGHRAKLTCSDRCRKAASRHHQQEAQRRQEEASRHARLERWQTFLPTTQRSLERLEALAGARLAEELAEAIRSERARPGGPGVAIRLSFSWPEGYEEDIDKTRLRTDICPDCSTSLGVPHRDAAPESRVWPVKTSSLSISVVRWSDRAQSER